MATILEYVKEDDNQEEVRDSPIEIEEYEEDELLHDHMLMYQSQLNFTRANNVFTLNVRPLGFSRLVIFQAPDPLRDNVRIGGDRNVAARIRNTVDSLRIVKRGFKSNVSDPAVKEAYKRNVSDAFLQQLNADISEQLRLWNHIYKRLDMDLFRNYLIGALNRDRLEVQATMILKMAREIATNGEDYTYACLYGKESVPVLHFLYKIKDVQFSPIHSYSYMELTYWSKSFLYDYYTTETEEGIRALGPMALSLIIDSASAISGKQISFINMEALYDTLMVLKKMQDDKLGINLIELRPDIMREYGFQERHLLVNTPRLSEYWKRFENSQGSDTKRQKCIQCGIVDAQLYHGVENLIFCGDFCHQDYANNLNNTKSFL